MTKILVIEDQEPLREEVLEVLNLEGFQAIGAENGRIGLTLTKEIKPDLILCDVMMPELDGYGVLTSLRQEPELAMIPFVFLTAKADKHDLRQGMKLGADDYLTKPFTRIELLETIAAQFRKHAAINRTIQDKLDSLRSNITLSLPHELHTPLSAILGLSEILMGAYQAIEPEEALEMLNSIHSSAERLYKLTQNFLLYAELELIMADADRVAALSNSDEESNPRMAIADMATYKADKAGRLADLHLDLPNIMVAISELKLRKITEEILDNALKFSQVGTSVEVVGRVDSNRFILSVTDQGRGMTSEQITNVGAYMQFERRLHEQQGSGLGLIIAKRITELYGGTLSLESIPSKQTTVRVTLRVNG